ncbi:NrsF family protein [Flaviflagellibacter deserti]|uniref:NrsF family protein n=1 Tax=Flaviflagellibacter deserti TaxID=2267266 RepID=A0ABV9YUF3_9HYPH
METNELIKALAADTRPPPASLSTVWWGAAALAAAVAAAVFLATLAPRPDLAAAAGTLRFLFKFVVLLTLALGAFGALRILSRPEGDLRKTVPLLMASPILLVAAVTLELFTTPSESWPERLMGTSNVYCFLLVMAIGLGPLSIFLLAMRHGAPSRSGIAGAVAGLLAGGIAGTIYVLHCTDDSPLFVATWYTLAIAGLSGLGALAAQRLVRW